MSAPTVGGVRRWALALAGALILLSGCSGAGTTSPASGSPSPLLETSSPSNSLPASSSSTPSDAVAPDGRPDPDWTAIVSKLLRQRDALARSPSVRAVRRVCLPASSCAETELSTVRFLVDRGLHVEGGPTYRIDSVEYQGTLDDVPLDEALEVVLILRTTFLSNGDGSLVREDGSVHSKVAADKSVVVGRQYSRSVALGRTSPRSRWKLSSSGALG